MSLRSFVCQKPGGIYAWSVGRWIRAPALRYRTSSIRWKGCFKWSNMCSAATFPFATLCGLLD
ncbi:hypothetical protein ID866_9148 [Astraeus odoratus]|nr:hypothetical protein ID866_9148 [Astraeus odoratus]